MKQGNLVVSLVLAVAILAGAYGLGLVIRHARTGDWQSQPVAEANAVAAMPKLQSEPRIGRAKPEPTPEPLAAEKEQEAEQLAQAEDLTEQQKQERREALRAELSVGKRQPGRLPHLSPEELKDIREKWPQMSEEERQAYRAKMRGARSVPPQRAIVPRDVNEGKEQAAEPNAAAPK